MAPVRNARVLFKVVPEVYPEPGKHIVYDESQTIDLDNSPFRGGVLLKLLAFSSDPYLRERMRDPSVDVVSFVPPFQLDQPIVNYSVWKVVRSETASYKPGSLVHASLPCQEYLVLDAEGLEQAEKLVFHTFTKEPGLPISAYIGACGMPGQSAYLGWHDLAEAKKGNVVFVTTAGGPVGSFVVQLAKAAGCKVIASAGTDTKVEFARSVGADVAFNYKTTSTEDVLQKEGPVDIYWDNVGGETLGIVFKYAAFRARIIACGYMSGYNTGYPPVPNVQNIFMRALKVYGFLGYNHFHLIPRFYKEIPPKVARGEIKYREDVKRGMQSVPQAIYEVQTGRNEGKSVIIISDD